MTKSDKGDIGRADRRSGLALGASRNLPKRFYKTADYRAKDDKFVVRLDGRSIKTPLKNDLILPTEPLTARVVEEWQNQGTEIDPDAMPLTKLANTALDHVVGKEDRIVDDIVAYAGSDLLCYRAAEPEDLVSTQKHHWDPILAWSAEMLGASFVLSEGIVHVSQPKATLDAIGNILSTYDAFRLTALHMIATLTGSALLAVGIEKGRLS
ncbi:MAG: ATP12 family chaperone protein, partial [Methyloligellaceae bacterium]